MFITKNLKDFFAPSKSQDGAGNDLEFNATQVLDILLKNWFPMDMMFQLLDSNPEDESNDDDHHDIDFGIDTVVPGILRVKA